MSELNVENLYASFNDKLILKGVDLSLGKGEIHALMGPNGSGKSTLAQVLMGDPSYKVTQGRILLNNKDITPLPPEERARRGMFLAFQYPVEVPGVGFFNFLRLAYNSLHSHSKLGVREFRILVQKETRRLGFGSDFITRNLNEGFSGGEKKKAEILQLAILKPRFAILDETDSGLDIDSLKLVAESVRKLCKDDSLGVLIITHYPRILQYIEPERVSILVEGRIVDQGDLSLVKRLEEEGYARY